MIRHLLHLHRGEQESRPGQTPNVLVDSSSLAVDVLALGQPPSPLSRDDVSREDRLACLRSPTHDHVEACTEMYHRLSRAFRFIEDEAD